MKQVSINLVRGLILYRLMECPGQEIYCFWKGKLQQVIHQGPWLPRVQLLSCTLSVGNWSASCHL